MRKSHKLGLINFDIIAVLKYTMVYKGLHVCKIFANKTACSEGFVEKHF